MVRGDTMRVEDVLLLVVDMQDRLLPVMAESDELVRKNRILIEGIKELGVSIVYTEQFPSGLGRTVDVLKSVMDDSRAYSFEKLEFSSFSTVRDVLEKNGKKSIIVSGIETHVCVYQTVRDLIENGYDVYVPFDAVSSRDLRNKENALNMLTGMGACVINVETILFDLLKTAEHGSFKFISKLIR